MRFNFRSESNIHVHTNESNKNAFSYIDGICYIKLAELRDTRLDFYSFGACSNTLSNTTNKLILIVSCVYL